MQTDINNTVKQGENRALTPYANAKGCACMCCEVTKRFPHVFAREIYQCVPIAADSVSREAGKDEMSFNPNCFIFCNIAGRNFPSGSAHCVHVVGQ